MPDDHDAIVQDWRDHAAKEVDANFRFLRSLKMVSNPNRVDALARELHAEAFGRLDCTRCANCCKTMPPQLSEKDIARIASHLRLSRDEFIAAYLEVDPEDGSYLMKTTPCPLLGEDDRCTIYDIRPEDCRSFPHTDKERFIWRTYGHAANTETCPGVYYIVKGMRRRRRRR